MATSPNQVHTSTDDVYEDLFKELDSLTAEGAAAADTSEDTQEIDDVLATAPDAQPVVDTAPTATPTRVESQDTAVTAAVTTKIGEQISLAVRAQFEKAQADQEVASLKAELEALRNMNTPAQKQFFEDFDDAALSLTPEEEEAYRDNVPVINKLITRAMNSGLAKYDRERVKGILDDTAAIRNQLGQVGAQVSNTSVEAFGMAVNTAMPDLGAKMRTAEWKAFMAKPAPYSDGAATMQDLWNYAESNRNIGAMNEIASGVQLAQDPAANMVAPGSSRAPAHTPSVGQKKVAYSSYLNAMARQQRGEMTYDKFLEFQNKFFQAEAAGLVDENA